MNKLRVIIIFALCLFYNNARTQSIESINYILDSVYYYYHYAHEINYNIQIELPDSVKQKAINVLDGYLPSQKIKEATIFSGEVIKDIEKKAKSICGEDSICNAFSKDSIIKCDIKHQLDIFRQAAFSSNFILAIGAWDVRGAEPILLKNINNKKYPKRETMLALAKLGNDSIYKLVMQEYTLKYVVNNTVLKDNDPDLIYESFPVDEQINYQISFFLSSRNVFEE